MTHFFSRSRPGQALGNGRQRGFSLIEIALVLVIVGLALGGIISAIGPQLENKKVSDTQDRIKQASDAIMAFAMVNHRLPCPAALPASVLAAQRGFSNPVNPGTGLCTTFDGFVPARTLGLGEQGPPGPSEGIVQDAWTVGLRYRVAQIVYNGPGNLPTLINCTSNCFPLTQADGIKNAYYNPGPPLVVSPIPPAGQLQICNSSTAITPPTCGGAATLATAAFVVWSTGRNGGIGGGADEAKNLDPDVIYVLHERRDANGAGGEFDDILQWQTTNSVVSNMIKAGVLP